MIKIVDGKRGRGRDAAHGERIGDEDRERVDVEPGSGDHDLSHGLGL